MEDSPRLEVEETPPERSGEEPRGLDTSVNPILLHCISQIAEQTAAVFRLYANERRGNGSRGAGEGNRSTALLLYKRLFLALSKQPGVQQ